MIENFKHKGLRRFYESNDRSGINPEYVEKIKNILSMLDAAEAPDEMDIITFHFHELKGARKGTYSVTVRANWRITFKFEDGNATDVNLEDYH
ncbi:MAG: type II toxin-antitoxin system RelE/ParE family toxin [Rickettsiales bacterium]